MNQFTDVQWICATVVMVALVFGLPGIIRAIAGDGRSEDD